MQRGTGRSTDTDGAWEQGEHHGPRPRYLLWSKATSNNLSDVLLDAISTFDRLPGRFNRLDELVDGFAGCIVKIYCCRHHQ